MENRNWVGEIGGKVEFIASIEKGPGDAELARNIAHRHNPSATVGRVWPENDEHWFSVVYPGQVMPFIMPAGVAGYVVEYSYQHPATVGRVYFGRERVGYFTVRDGAVSVGRFGYKAVTPSAALVRIVREHRDSLDQIAVQAAAFGCPA